MSLTKQKYQDIRALFLSKIQNLIIYVPREDFIQECFAGICKLRLSTSERAIKESIKYAQRHTRPPRHGGRHMFEIPIGILRGDIEHPRQFTREY